MIEIAIFFFLKRYIFGNDFFFEEKQFIRKKSSKINEKKTESNK